jgi:uncharacterized protein (DUF1800 family)
MKKVDKYTRFKHLYLRAGFGTTFARLQDVSAKSIDTAVTEIFRDAEKFTPLKVVDDNTLAVNKEKIKELQGMNQTERRIELKNALQESREKIRDLNILWLNRMASGENSLREKMTLFWHGHFACQNSNAFFVQKQHNLLREKALGKFGDLLMAVSKDPAMLAFLNNRQNRKDKPNENFAREVMELFTLGRGNYTESDIKNAARAFTGWNFNQDGEFVFNQRQHDFDEKSFFGKTGKLEGEDVIGIILENKQTARFITTKIYRYFVNDTPDNKIINSLSEKFYKSDYDIAHLMKLIFSSDWFYDDKNIGTRIKSPVELLAGLQNTFNITFQDPQGQLFIQKVLGQILFYPPNVAGWKEGKNWIDSSSLMFRLQLPELLFTSAETTIKAKEDGDVNTEYLSKKNSNRLKVTANWNDMEKAFAKTKDAELLNTLSDYLLQYKILPAQQKLIESKADKTSRESLLKSYTLAIASLPEYQMC